MKKVILATLMILLATWFSSMGCAETRMHVGVASPPPMAFSEPPQMIVLPGTYVYVAPDVPEDIFFYRGYWWRPWEGRWYRSRNYHEGWVYYKNPPSVLMRVPSGWRNDYRNRHWRGNEWNYNHIPYGQLKQKWSYWEKSRHWEQPEYRQTRELKGREQEQRGREHEGRGREPYEQRGRDYDERR